MIESTAPKNISSALNSQAQGLIKANSINLGMTFLSFGKKGNLSIKISR